MAELASFGSGALRPPPPVVAPLVPRCALLPAATPRLVLGCRHPRGLGASLSLWRYLPRMSVVSLLTDFGLDDAYVGQMKGAILSVSSAVTLVDLTHAVAPQDVVEGGFL